MPDEEPKIIIDEDWKTQVERERREDADKEPATESKPSPSEDDEEISLFEQHISGLAAQAMMALGLIAPEGQAQVVVDLGMAKFMIDTLAMLREKTQGNLNPAEVGTLNEAVAELQRAFSVRTQQAHAAQQESSKQQGPGPIRHD